jgi:hypothetical protein
VLIDVLADGPPLTLQLLSRSRRVIRHGKFTFPAFSEDACRISGGRQLYE